MIKVAKKIGSTFSNAGGLNQEATVRLRQAAQLFISHIYGFLETNPEGLTAEEVEQKQEQYGLNDVRHDRPPTWYRQLLDAFINPFVGILVLIAVVSFIIDVWLAPPEEKEYKTVVVVSIMVLISSMLRFVQEFKSSRAAERLKSMVKTTATVHRQPAGREEVEIGELVPGDIIFLSAGDMIPADCRILQSKDLFINQSVLTGEALPVEKRDHQVDVASKLSTLELTNLCFMGTNVESGTATAIVVNTGNLTYFGSISSTLSGKRAETSFDKGIKKISWLLIRFMVVMVPLIFLINGLVKGNWFDALLFAIAVAVGLTPEMLPMIVTANLAKGAVSMSKRKVIVKRLNAIQNLGAMDVLCTDKTGTLTLDKIVLERHLNVMGYDDHEVLKWAYLNSYHQTGLKSLLDMAILQHVELHDTMVEERYEKVDEIPFDFMRRRLSVILRQNDGKHLLICKGAVEEMLDMCSLVYDPGDDNQLQIASDEVVPLQEEMRDEVLRQTKKLNEDGMRVLLVAVKFFEDRELNYSVADEKDMLLIGLIGFLDPAKPTAKDAIESLHELGVAVKVLTGDNEVVTGKVCREVGIPVITIMLGSELEQLSDSALRERIDGISIFAKLSPDQKIRVVQNLQAIGHTVGFMGDGINDAGALRVADVGISVDTATDISKESADIILLEKDLTVLRKGIVYGRRTFGNILKYIKMTASSNFGNMFSMLGASVFLPFLPMLPAQLLLQNLLYDMSQIAIPLDTVDKEYIDRPRKWDTSGITRFILYIGPISSIFDYATFALMYFFFKASTIEHQSLFQSGWFVEGLLSQTLIVHLIRTRKVPFFQSWATPPVILLTLLIMTIGIAIPMMPWAGAMGLQPLPPLYFLFLVVILVSYALLTQVVKGWFIRKFHDF
ncbi:MAG TPA: magnesium-translocating P-type ATPase [Williamwhitmania sp.]|nr:magnesium-translocating P-type ATPase [Williamwhitmania sp.]